MHVNVPMCTPVRHTWTPQQNVGVFLYRSVPHCLETGSATELKLSSVGWLGSELCGSAHLCPTVLELQTWAGLSSCFTQVMGIQTQVLMLAEPLFLPTKPSPQHKPVRVQIHILTKSYIRALPRVDCIKNSSQRHVTALFPRPVLFDSSYDRARWLRI